MVGVVGSNPIAPTNFKRASKGCRIRQNSDWRVARARFQKPIFLSPGNATLTVEACSLTGGVWRKSGTGKIPGDTTGSASSRYTDSQPLISAGRYAPSKHVALRMGHH